MTDERDNVKIVTCILVATYYTYLCNSVAKIKFRFNVQVSRQFRNLNHTIKYCGILIYPLFLSFLLFFRENFAHQKTISE